MEVTSSQDLAGSTVGAESPEKANSRNPGEFGGEMGVLAVLGDRAMLR